MKNYTLAEAAAELRVSLRSMSNIVARHPHYYAVGNRKLFTEEDLQKIIAGLREEAAEKAGGAMRARSAFVPSYRKATNRVLKRLEALEPPPKKK